MDEKGQEPWRFHDELSELTGPCRRRWCFQCWRYRRGFRYWYGGSDG